MKLNVIGLAVLFLFGCSDLDIVVFEAHVLFDDSLYFHFSIWTSCDAERHVDGLSVLLFHNFSMVLKYRIEIRKSQVPVKLFYLGVQLRVRVSLVPHGIIILWRVLQRIEIIVLNISSA